MRLKQCIFALMAMLLCAFSANAQGGSVAKIGDTEYTTFADAMAAANAATGNVTVEVYGAVEFVDGMELNGSYTAITFTGKSAEAKITIKQTAGGDYLTAHGKTVAFNDLILAKANPAWSGNSGHMGNYFSIQGGTVTYTDCTFPNGACTSGGTATYDDCTFQNASEYGLWVYDDALVTVNGGTIDSTKGIKVYSEGEDSVTSTLTVQNATFTENVTAKPAVAVGYAQSITLIGNTYNNTTAHVELDSGSDADCEGITFVAEDSEGNDIASTLEMTDRSNSNAACGVLVDGKIYTTVTTAAAEATSGSTVTLLYNTTETVELPEGVTLDRNGFTADNVTVEVSLAGEGTEASPYLISSVADLKTLRNKVNAGNSYEGKFVKLAADLTLTEAWTPIGNGTRSSKSYSGNAFKGTFDGDNNTISGLKITSTAGNDAAIGLFGVVDGGTVKNLTLNNVDINVTNSNLAGGAIGLMLGGATAENITVNGVIVGNDGVGGIVGRLVINGTIKNCTNNASVKSSYGGIGGIVGKAYYEDGTNTTIFASIDNCTNNGTVTAPMYVGGIVGLARANVTDCVNNGPVVGGTQTGGIIGQLIAAGTVSGNENKAKITGKNHLGGIIGDYSQSSAYTYYNVAITSNINRGELAATEQCAAIMGCNNIDGFTAMTATGNLSYYFVDGLELFGNPEDMVIDATNKFMLPVAKIGDVEYATLAEAVAAAQAGDEIVLLGNVAEDATLPAGITFNGNGKTVGNLKAGGAITFKGVTKATSFGVEYTNTTVNIVAGACLEITGTGRMVIGHGCTFNITGNIENAKTADVAALTPSLIIPGASFTGAGVTFNVTNAYISAPSSYCSSSKSASGTFDFNITNSIWESAGKLAFEAQSTAATVNFDLVNSVLNTGSHLVFAVSSGEVVIDNSNVNVGSSRQIENRSTMTIKNGSVVNGAVATSSNAINPGTIIVEEATYAVTGEFSGAAEGTGTLVIKKGANVSVGSIKAGANVTVDAEGMTASDVINFTADLSQFTGTLSVINNDKLDASIVDGKIVLAVKPVAKIGDTKYATLDEAFAAAAEGATITLLADATPALTSQRAITKAAVIDLGGKTLTLTEDDLYFGTTTFKNGTIVVDPSVSASTAVFWMFANQTLTFDAVKVIATGLTGTYLIGINDGTGSSVNLLNGSSITIDNSEKAELSAVIADNGNGNSVIIKDSNIDVKNVDARLYLGGQNGSVTIENSDIVLNGVKEGFYLRAGQALAINGTSNVDITLNADTKPRYGINMTDATATYTKAETATVNATVYAPATGSNSFAYTKEENGYVRVWGEGGGNAKESYELKLYSGETLIATTQLNNVGNVIDGDVYVTWNFYYPQSNDEYWTTTWVEGHPNSAAQPTEVELYIDGTLVATTAAKMSGADDVAPVVWRNLGGVAIADLLGDGTETSPYLISNKKELLWFQAKVDELATDGSTQFAGKYFKLTADIDLNNENWNPIGSMSGDHGSFKGVFDGGDHTISNLKVEQAGNGIGLFARTAGNAVIKNLKLNNVSVKSTDNSNYAGALVGNAYASTKIENVHVSGNVYVSGRGYIGGIAGHGYVVMDNVSVVATGDGQGNDKGLITSTFWCAGGILGYAGEGSTNIMNANVENVVVTSAAGGLGAIVGMAEDNNGTQPISGSNLSAKDVDIKTYIGAYGDAYANYALGYLYGGNPTSKLTGELSVENVTLATSNGVDPTPVDAAAKVNDAIYFSLAKAIAAAQPGDVVKVFAGTYPVPAMKAGITIEGAVNADGTPAVLLEGTLKGTLENLTLKNLHIKGGNAQRYAYANGNLVFENVTFEATSVYALHFDGIEEGTTLLYKNCTIIGWAAMGGSPASCVFEGCTIKDNGTYGVIRTYFDATIKDCTFDVANANTGDIYQDGIHAVDGAEIAVNGCTNANGEMKDLVNVSGASVVTVDGVEFKNVAKIGDSYYATINEAIAAIGAGDVVIELLDNATFDYNARDAYGTAETTSVTINGNGKTLTLNQKDSDWASIGLAAGKLVLKDMTIEKTGYGDTSGAWNTHAIIFSCPVEMTDVTVNNGIAVQAGATLNNVTINEANGYYGLWVNGNGQTVTVSGGEINATNGGRGIKVADEYIASPVQVTLNVTDTEFNTAKKAAVLVTSTAGAKITASNVDIANVAEDNVNFVWVDEDRAANYGAVEVTGAAVAQESVELFPIVVKNGDKIVAYFKNLDDAIVAAENGATITVINDFAIDEMVTVAAGKELTIDLNGKTITGTDNTSKNFSIIDNRGNLTIKDSSAEKSGKITLTATIDSDWGRYSAVIANNPGGKLTIDGGTLEHLGGTDMAYGIDNLTNGKGTYAETVINGGTIKSTYRGIRQFLNGIEAQNILTINGGNVEGANKSVWMQDPNKNANTGTLTVGENAKLVGDAYLSVTAGSTEWPVEVSIAAAALQGVSKVMTSNVPAGYELAKINNTYSVALASDLSASINGIGYITLAEAITAAQPGDVIKFLKDINESVTINKNVTIDGADKQYTGTMTDNAGLTVTVQNVNFVNGGFAKTAKGATGNYTFKDCTFDGAKTYAYPLSFKGANTINVENCTVKDYAYSFLYVPNGTNVVSVKNVTVENCPNYAVYFASGVNSATFEKLTVKKSNRGFLVNNTANRAFTIKDCTMKNVDTAIEHSKGTNAITCTALGVNDFGGAALSEYAVIKGATITGTTYYGSVKGMVEKALNGQTVQLLSDITLDTANDELASCDGYPTFVYVEGKAVTVDLNGKAITADAHAADLSSMLLGVFSTDKGGELTLVDNSAEGTATVTLNANDAQVYSLICNYNPGCKITVEGGTYVADKVRDCLIFSGAREDALVTVNGGNFTLGNVGAGENGKPWIFNVLGQNEGSVLVKGGTFNADINHQFWAHEVFVPETKALKNNGDGTWTVVDAVAYTEELATSTNAYSRKVGYATLTDAVAAVGNNETVTLLKDITYTKETGFINGEFVDGFVYTGDKSFTVDFNGKTVTDDGCVNDYLIYINNKGEKASEITFTNGTIVSKNGCWSAVCVNSSAATQNVVLNLNGMNITNSNDAEYSGNPVVRVRNLATVNVNDKTVITSNGASYGVAANTDGSTLNINEGATIVQQNSGTTGGNSVFAAVGGKGVINIYDGAVIESDKYGVHNMTTGNAVINIYGGTIEAPVIVRAATNGYDGQSADVYISGGTFEGDMEEYTDKANIHVSGGVFDRPVHVDFCAEGYVPCDNADGTYGVMLNEVHFVDGEFTEYNNSRNMTVGTLTYKRSSIPTTWTPFYVPFEVPVSQLAEHFEVAYINGVRRDDKNFDGELDDDKFAMEVIYIHGGNADGSAKTLKANYPYFIRSKGSERKDLYIELHDALLYAAKNATYDCSTFTEKFEITGNASQLYINSTADALVYGVSGGGWTNITTGATLKPFRFYMTLTSRDGSAPVTTAAASMSIVVRGEELPDGTTLIYDINAETGDNVIYDLNGRRVLETEKGNIYIINGKKVLVK